MTLTPEQTQRLHFEDGLVPEGGAEGAADVALGGAVRDALAPVHVPLVSADVMTALGVEPLVIADAIRAAAGKDLKLWPGVAAQIGAPEEVLGGALRETLIQAADEAPAFVPHRRWPWALGIVAAAAAAAILVVQLVSDPERIVEPVATALDPVVEAVEPVVQAVQPVVHGAPNEVEIPGLTEIESLESETATILQVLQFDDNAPTIIFIDED